MHFHGNPSLDMRGLRQLAQRRVQFRRANAETANSVKRARWNPVIMTFMIIIRDYFSFPLSPSNYGLSCHLSEREFIFVHFFQKDCSLEATMNDTTYVCMLLNANLLSRIHIYREIVRVYTSKLTLVFIYPEVKKMNTPSLPPNQIKWNDSPRI